MKASKRIVIKNGEVVSFDGDVSFDGMTVHKLTKKRVSHIIPTNRVKALAFLLIRSMCSDDSKAAEWTRGWVCDWTVIIDKKRYPGFQCRQEAITFEKDLIWEQNKLQKSLN